MEEKLTDKQRRFLQAWCAHLCQKTFNKHCALVSGGMRRRALEELWVQGPDTCLGQNDGFWIGFDSVYAAYVTAWEKALEAGAETQRKSGRESAENGDGVMVLHASTTPVIETAGDLQTAKGMFYSPGYVTTIEADGRPRARWVMQRYAVDFLRQGDEFKIWHMFIGVDYTCEVGGRPYQLSPVPAFNRDKLPLLDGIGFGGTFIPPYDLDVPGLFTSIYGWCGYPPEPEPYETFSETFSYGCEPFLGSEPYASPEKFHVTSEQRFNFSTEVV